MDCRIRCPSFTTYCSCAVTCSCYHFSKDELIVLQYDDFSYLTSQIRELPLRLSFNQFGFYPHIHYFISLFSRRFGNYLTYKFSDMLYSLILVSLTDKSADDRHLNTCLIPCYGYICQRTFMGAPLNSTGLLMPLFILYTLLLINFNFYILNPLSLL